jgi:hypothetical protein
MYHIRIMFGLAAVLAEIIHSFLSLCECVDSEDTISFLLSSFIIIFLCDPMLDSIGVETV